MAHGITPLEQFNGDPADRVFHPLLLLGGLRVKPSYDPDPPAGESVTAGESARPDGDGPVG